MSKMAVVSHKAIVKVFKHAGFTVSRISGDHIIMKKNGISRPLVIPKKQNIPVFIILNNLKIAGISKQEYKMLLYAIR